jgi:hypothetical protein
MVIVLFGDREKPPTVWDLLKISPIQQDYIQRIGDYANIFTINYGIYGIDIMENSLE